MKEEDKADITFIDEINTMVWFQRGISLQGYDPIKLCEEAYQKALRLGYRYGEARCLLNLGMGAFIIEHNAEKSFQFINSSIDLFRELNELRWIANAQLTLSITQNTQGNPEAALYNGLKGIDYYDHHPEEMEDRIMAYYVVGTVYKDLKKFTEAKKYYQQGLQAVQGIMDTWVGRIYASLSNIYVDEEKYEEALNAGQNALQILKEEKNVIGVSRAVSDIGMIYKRQKDYENALHYLFEGLKIREEFNIRQFIVTSLIEIASVYREMKETTRAIEFFERAEKIAMEINLLPKITRICEELVDIYKSKEDYKQALHYSEKNLRLSAELSRKEAEKKINNLKDHVVKEKEEEIERLRNVELKAAYHLISEKQKEILDSINYAHRIQKALITPESYIERNLSRLKNKSNS